MDNQSRRVLILDSDPDTLIGLQHAFEEAGVDTDITWDEREACTLLGTKRFDLIVLGDHPPEVDAAAILQDFSYRGTCPPVLILRAAVREKDVENFRRMGAIGIAPKRDTAVILERIAKALAPMLFKINATNAGSETRAWRAAS